MSSYEVSIWIDGEKADALSKRLAMDGRSLEQVVADKIETLYQEIVPAEQRDEIELHIVEERERREREEAERRKYALIKIRKDGQEYCFEDEFYTRIFQIAEQVRYFCRGDKRASDMLFMAEPPRDSMYRKDITLTSYNEQASRFGSIKQVLRVFDIDLDNGYFSIADKKRGSATFHITDILTAAYFAGKGFDRSAEWREDELFRRLEGKVVCMNQPVALEL